MIERLENWAMQSDSGLKKISRALIVLTSMVGMVVGSVVAISWIIKTWPLVSAVVISSLFISYVWWVFENDPTKEGS